jgi:hypothetical protein
MSASHKVDRTDYKKLYTELLKKNGKNQAEIMALTTQASNSALDNVQLLDIFARMREDNNHLKILVQTIISHPEVDAIDDEKVKSAIAELADLNEESILNEEDTTFIEVLENHYYSAAKAEYDANPIADELSPAQFNWGDDPIAETPTAAAAPASAAPAPAAPASAAPAAPAAPAVPQKGENLKKNRPHLFKGTPKAIISAELQRCEVHQACKFGFNCKSEQCKFYHFCNKITPIDEERVQVDCEKPAHACKYVHVTCGCNSPSCKAVHLGKIHHSIAHLYQ